MMPQNDLKNSLRRLELEAYCSVVSALRAQGDLTADKRGLLKDLQDSLKISAERHRAEVRRAVNDDELMAIADGVSEEIEVSAEWQLEGRRLIPSLPRHLQSATFASYSHSLSKLDKTADGVRSLSSTRPTREARLEHRSVDSISVAGRLRKQRRFDGMKWSSTFPHSSSFTNSTLASSSTVTTDSLLSSQLTCYSMESLPASAVSSINAVVSVHETSVSSDNMLGHTRTSLDVTDSGPALAQTQQVIYQPMSMYARQRTSSHDAPKSSLDYLPRLHQFFQHLQPAAQFSQEASQSTHPRHMLRHLSQDSLPSEQYVQLSNESLATSQHMVLCASDAVLQDSQDAFQLHDTFQSLHSPTTVSVPQVKLCSAGQGLNTSHDLLLHQSVNHRAVHSPHNPSNTVEQYPGYSMQQLQSEQAVGQSTSHNSSPVLLSRSMPSTRVAPTHIRSAPPTPKVIIVSGTGMSSATTISGPPPTVTSSQAIKPVPGKMAVIATSKTATPMTASAPSGTEPLPALASPVIPVYSSVSSSASAMRNIRPPHLFNPRSMPIFRPRPLTARIRTPHTSVSATNLQLSTDSAAVSSSMIVSYKPAALGSSVPGHSIHVPAASTTIILGHGTSFPAHSTVAISGHDTIAPGQSAPLSSQTATLVHKGLGSGSNIHCTTPQNLNIQLKSINSRHPSTDAVQMRQDGVGNLPSNRVILSEGTLRRNVIVVQKQAPVIDKSCETTAVVSTSSNSPAATNSVVKISSPFEKELVSFIQKQDIQHGQYNSQLKRCSKDVTTIPLVTCAVSSASDAENIANCSPLLRLSDSFVSPTCVTVTKNDVSRLSSATDSPTTDRNADVSDKNYTRTMVASQIESQIERNFLRHQVDMTRSHDHLPVVLSEATLKSDRNRRKCDSVDGATKALKLATCKPAAVFPNIEPVVTNFSQNFLNAQLPICVLSESLGLEDNFFGQADDLLQPSIQDGQDKSSFLRLSLDTMDTDTEESAMLDCDSSATASANSTMLEYDAFNDIQTGSKFTSQESESTVLQHLTLNESEECDSCVEQVGPTSSVGPECEAVPDSVVSIAVQPVAMQNINAEECIDAGQENFGVQQCYAGLGCSLSATELDAVQECSEADGQNSLLAGDGCAAVSECIGMTEGISSVAREECTNAQNVITEIGCIELAAGEYSSEAGRNSCKSDSDEYDESEPGTDEWVELSPDECDPLSAEDGDEQLTEDESRPAAVHSKLSSVESLSVEQLAEFIVQKSDEVPRSSELMEAIQFGDVTSETLTELTVAESDSCLIIGQQEELAECHDFHVEQHAQPTEDVLVDNFDDFTAETQTELIEIEPCSWATEQHIDNQLQVTAVKPTETDFQPDSLQHAKLDIEQCHRLNELNYNIAVESASLSLGLQDGHNDSENKSLVGEVDSMQPKLGELTYSCEYNAVVDRNNEIVDSLDCSTECTVAAAAADVGLNIDDHLSTNAADIVLLQIDAINTDLTDQNICLTALSDADLSDAPSTSDSLHNQLHTPSGPREPSSASCDGSQLSPLAASATSIISLGKRKRRPPLSPDHDLSLSVSGWGRLALALLGRVMRFRCLNGDKNRSNPSAWFNQPVDADEVPDYYDIIRNPMDFGTIKKKLETAVYADWAAFHADMMLVKENCCLYNAPGTQVRYDCDLVFNFYQQECNKMSSKLQQGSPVKRQKSEQQSH